MKLFISLFLLLTSLSAMADCSRYYIIYIENQTDGDIEFELKDKEYVIKMDLLKRLQREDLMNVIADSQTPVPNKCRFFINGHDLIKKDGESNLTRIYQQINTDGTNAPVDMFSLTHGDTEGEIEVVKEVSKNEYMSVENALFKDIPSDLRSRLGIFHNAACYGVSSNLMATNAGFAASVGSDDETLGPLVLREFLKNYLNGLTLKETAQEILNTCVQSEEWRQTIKYALDEDDYEDYCNKAIIAIVGNSAITVRDNADALNVLKQEHLIEMKKFGKKFDGDYGEELFRKTESNGALYRPMLATQQNKFKISSVSYKQQFGSNPVGQVDINFENFRIKNYISIDNINFSNKGIIGGQVTVLNEGSVQAGLIKRDYAKGILFQVNIISLKKTFYVTGGDNGKGFSWQYILSAKSNLGYLMVRDKAGEKRHFAHIGATINNEINVRYKRISLETNTGYDLMLIHPMSSPFYSNGKLQYNMKKAKVGGYADYNSMMGFSAGFSATVNLDVLKRKKKKKSRR